MALENNEMDGLQKIVKDKLQITVCEECIKLFITSRPLSTTNATKPIHCSICLGILNDKFVCTVIDHIRTSFEAYGGFDGNVVSKEAPTVAIPVHTAIRAQCLLAAISNANIEGVIVCESSASEIYTKIKDAMRNKLRSRLQKCTSKTCDALNDLDTSIRNILQREENGLMNCHVIINAPNNTALPTQIMPIPQSSKKRERKRFRGNDPTDKQGGDPRVNLYKRMQENLNRIFVEATDDRVKDSLKASMAEKNLILDNLDSATKKTEIKAQFSEWITTLHNEHDTRSKCSVHVASWRQPFYLKGRYTKSRRDCSQTPFFVSCDKDDKDCGNMNKMKRLGITSVEEEICPVVSSIACSGISKQNNEILKDSKASNIVYGMAKFHASGREDMDVRMILPRDALDAEKASLVGSDQTIKKSGTSSGRPFVLEVIDAYQMPNREGLDKAHCAINYVANAEETVALGITPGSSIWVEEKERTHVQYGVNPKGVGISGLDFCPASCFSNLQSETEDKVKFYGCLCWSHQRIPNQGYLDSLLNNSMCPLEISQSTPLRVLHRRSKAVRVRHVLSLKPHRIDDHWFRLEMSTTAGTYVKEFCHGDLRRTSPSVSSLLGCKVDIVELDCHGIATK